MCLFVCLFVCLCVCLCVCVFVQRELMHVARIYEYSKMERTQQELIHAQSIKNLARFATHDAKQCMQRDLMHQAIICARAN